MKSRLLFFFGLLYIVINPRVNAQCAVVTSTNTSTLACGVAPLNGCSVVYIGDGVTPMTLFFNANLDLTCLGAIQFIVRNGAALDFSPGNNNLRLALGSSIAFLPGSNLIGGSCNASERIYIGADLIASCNGGAGADFTFAQLLAAGGYNIVTDTSPLHARCGSGTFLLTAVAAPPSGAAIQWYTVPSGGTPVATGSSYTTPILTGSTTYYVEAYYSALSMTSPRIAVNLTVNALPATPGIGTITQPTCSVSTASVVVNNLPSSGTWTLTRSGTSGATTTGSGTSTTISGLSPGTYAFTVSDGVCTSAISTNVVISTAQTVWNGSSWSNGIPSLSKSATISGNYVTAVTGSFSSCSLTISLGATLTISENDYIEVQNEVTNNGTLNIQNNGSLIQINNASVNSGSISMERIAIVNALDYVYWSSPVAGFSASNISPTTSNIIYKWIPTIPANVNGHGNWTSGNEIMTIGKGYIERGLTTATASEPASFQAFFTGVPNNGTISIPISRGTYDVAINYNTNLSNTFATKNDDNWNLLGNPYPSSISLYEFLTTNSNIGGFIKIWEHQSAPLSTNPNPFYNTYAYNYNSNDYVTYNLAGSSAGSASDYFIGAGQGFFVLMNANTAATTENVTFNNQMRNKNYRNDLFVRAANVNSNSGNNGRIWLDIVSSTANRRTMVGYVNGATDGKDRLFDAMTNFKLDFNIYSIIDYEGQIIQSRKLPFDVNDQVPLGFKVPRNDTYTIAIAEIDGFFQNTNQTIYLEDRALNLIHNLSVAPYTFSAVSGIHNERFVLRFTTPAFTANSFEIEHNKLVVHPSNEDIVIQSSKDEIKEYAIFDILGRKIASKDNVGATETMIATIEKNNQVLVVKVTFMNGQTEVKKILH